MAPIAGQTNPGAESGGRGEKKSSLFLRIEKKQWAGLEAQTFGHNQERMRHCSPSDVSLGEAAGPHDFIQRSLVSLAVQRRPSEPPTRFPGNKIRQECCVYSVTMY